MSGTSNATSPDVVAKKAGQEEHFQSSKLGTHAQVIYLEDVRRRHQPEADRSLPAAKLTKKQLLEELLKEGRQILEEHKLRMRCEAILASLDPRPYEIVRRISDDKLVSLNPPGWLAKASAVHFIFKEGLPDETTSQEIRTNLGGILESLVNEAGEYHLKVTVYQWACTLYVIDGPPQFA